MSLDAKTLSLRLTGRVGTFDIDVAFDAPMRGVTAVFGPSGCGKTTILRAIAGLTNLPGRLTVGEEVWQDTSRGIFLAPHRRHVGYVFQEASLFPHLSVRDNLLYGARRVRATSKAPPGRVDEIVGLLGIARLLDRDPTTLSGGERQRVAVGRALLAEPRVLLMDEPLSALDRMTKDEILPYLETLHETLALPVLYVSHDLSEVERLADRLVLLENGRVRASGPLATLQTDPALPLLWRPDASVVIEGVVVEHDRHYGLTGLDVPGGRLIVPGTNGAVGDARRLRIVASDVSLARTAPRDSTILNCLPARIQSLGKDDAPQITAILALGSDGTGARIAARITRKSATTLALQPGDAVFAQIKSVALLASPTQSQAPTGQRPADEPGRGRVLP